MLFLLLISCLYVFIMNSWVVMGLCNRLNFVTVSDTSAVLCCVFLCSVVETLNPNVGNTFDRSCGFLGAF